MGITSIFRQIQDTGKYRSDDYFEFRKTGKVLSIRFTEKQLEKICLDDKSWAKMVDAFKQCNAETLQLDFLHVNYISSLVLNKIVSLKLKIRRHGGHFSICNLNQMLLEVFRVTRLDRVLMISNEASADLPDCK